MTLSEWLKSTGHEIIFDNENEIIVDGKVDIELEDYFVVQNEPETVLMFKTSENEHEA